MITQPMIITFLILIIATVLFIQGKHRSELIAVGSLLMLTVFGILTPEEALAGFSNPAVIMIAGLSIVGAGIFDSGLARNMGDALLRYSGNSEKKLLFLIIIIVSLCSAVLSNTGTVSVLLPIVMSVAFQLHMNPSRFLLPLAFASSIGGLLTLIGAPSNLIVNEALGKFGFEKLTFFEITGVGLVAVLAGLFFMMTIGQTLLPRYIHLSQPQSVEKSMSPGELAGLYKVYDQLHFIYVPETSEIVGERLADLRLPFNYEITVIEIERQVKEKLSLKQSKQSYIAKASEIIHPNDLLLVFGGTEQVNHFARQYELEQKPFHISDVKAHFLRRAFGLTEILVAPHSSLEGKTIVDLHFREKYNCNVLAINRKGDYYLSDIAHKKLTLGDALLVHGKWENIALISKDKRDVVVLGTAEEKTSSSRTDKSTVASLIMGIMLFLMIFDILSPVISIVLAAFLMIVTRCISSMEEAYTRVNWEPVILLAVMIPLATALQKTGGIQFLSNQFLTLFGGFGELGILISLYILTSIIAQFFNNIAATVMLAPIALTVSVDAGISPYPLLIGITAAVSMSFSTPFSSPANALVLTAGGYSYKDFVRVGLPLQLFIGICLITVVSLFFPF